MMKRILFILTLLAIVAGATAQEAYNEAIRMARDVVDDTSKPLDMRKVAQFKYDALYYMGRQAMKTMPNDPSSILDYQARALFQFMNLFYGQYTMSTKRDKPAVIEYFKKISLAHPLFNDQNKSYVLAYLTFPGAITQFSLDTDWVAAYNDIRKGMPQK